MQWELLAELPDDVRRTLISSAVRRRFAKGEVIFHEGDPGDTLHLIVRGRVAVRLSTSLGDTTLLRVLGQGGWFGDLSMICPAERNATIVALEPVETLVVARAEADDLRRRVPQFETMLVNALVAEVRRLSTALLDALFVPVDKRLYRNLLRLDDVYGSEGGPTSIPLTQEEIAQLVGTTRPTVNKHLRAAADAGFLSMRRGNLEILDREAIAVLGLAEPRDDVPTDWVDEEQLLIEKVEAARSALTSGEPAAATELLEEALELGRPSVMPAQAEPVASRPGDDGLEELRLGATELLLDAWLLRADLDQGMDRFDAATDRYPDREGVWARAMVALYRQGRPSDALAAYQQLFARLGGEPSDWVVRLERDITFRDPVLLQPTVSTFQPASRVALATSHRADVELPEGVITFLMTDVVGSTRLWEREARLMRAAMVRHDQLMILAVESHAGILIRERGEGDSTFSVFRRATDAAAGALAAQMAFAQEPWSPACALRVRMALHTAEASPRDGDYYGRVVNRVARLRSLADGGQILASQSTAEIVMDHLPEGTRLHSLGPRELKDMDRPETVYLVSVGQTDEPAPPGEAPALASPGPDAGSPSLSSGGDGPGPARPREATWQLVVGADRDYFESNGEDLGDFPDPVVERTHPLAAPVVVIGRGTPSSPVVPDIDLGHAPADIGVSRGQHAVLERQPDGRYALADAASTNGTFLNDLASPIPSGVRTMLEDGDRVYLGHFSRLLVRRRTD